MTQLDPLVEGHQQPVKLGSLNQPKMMTRSQGGVLNCLVFPG